MRFSLASLMVAMTLVAFFCAISYEWRVTIAVWTTLLAVCAMAGHADRKV